MNICPHVSISRVILVLLPTTHDTPSFCPASKCYLVAFPWLPSWHFPDHSLFLLLSGFALYLLMKIY